ncbi:hypothetical protein K8O68_09465 [Salipaludibacillus sp. CUR1]|uniref:hypothetical protein n=1 Tax=Salipaludibacillus sp. CUR1 TaxID=2820003 RepID=UPI001E3028DD|nr:hypothetical protein [Salipaludibacillus sp. CUR1]MCE7792642.1 hypothetical protein [Salipaludibacillus sp. CUR1]
MSTEYILTTGAVVEGEQMKHEAKTLIAVEPGEAESLVNSGMALRVDTAKLDKYETETNRLVEQAKKEISAMRNSGNPAHTKEVKEYEIKQIRQRLEDEVNEINKQWQAEKAEMEKEATELYHTYEVKISDKERQKANQIKDDFLIAVATGNAADAMADFKERLNYVNHSTLQALKSHYSELSPILDDNFTATQKRTLLNEINREPQERLATAAVRQLPDTADLNYRMWRAVTDRK